MNGEFYYFPETDSQLAREERLRVRVDTKIDDETLRVYRTDTYEMLFVNPSELHEITDSDDASPELFEDLCCVHDIIDEVLDDLEWNNDAVVRETAKTVREKLGKRVEFCSFEKVEALEIFSVTLSQKNKLNAEREKQGLQKLKRALMGDLTLGYARMIDGGKTYEIGFAATAWPFLSAQEKREVVVHELGHVYCYAHPEVSPWVNHGEPWQRAVALMGGNPEMAKLEPRFIGRYNELMAARSEEAEDDS